METAVIEARDQAMAQVGANAGTPFSDKAYDFIQTYLSDLPAGASGEDITDACKAAGIIPHDDRAFGPVFMRLAKHGVITKAGYRPRAKGHGTGGANVWRLTNP